MVALTNKTNDLLLYARWIHRLDVDDDKNGNGIYGRGNICELICENITETGERKTNDDDEKKLINERAVNMYIYLGDN